MASYLNPSALAAADLSPPAEVVAWTRDHAVPFKTVEAGNGFADLEPLRAMIGSARIVALGETTHGSREVSQMKHRLVEFLAREMGFTVLAVEANMPEAHRVNDYALGGEGDPAALMRGLYFSIWRTPEALELVQWMRRFNLDPANRRRSRRVEFAGFDMQEPEVPAAFVREALANDTEWRLKADAAIEALRGVRPRDFGEDTTARARELWPEIETHLRDAARGSTAGSPARWAAQNARIVNQSLEMNSVPGQGFARREASMVENVQWLLAENSGAKIVLWAHNGHVRRATGAMGGLLAGGIKDEMIVLGFATAHGSYGAFSESGYADFSLQPPPPESAEAALAATGVPRFFLDLRPARRDGARNWFMQPHAHRLIGGGEAKEQFLAQRSLARDYDALVWIEHTTASHPLH